ncbi:MAG: hypothetical protein HKP52_06950 [Desulfofustis sp.]|nr:hypothetical protein [Desulfofustis sp.]
MSVFEMNRVVKRKPVRWSINYRAPIWALAVLFAIGLLLSSHDYNEVGFDQQKSTRVGVRTIAVHNEISLL